MAVSKRLRYEVLRRDNHACRYCGAVAPDATLTIDHVVPAALGGRDEPENLVAACTDCNNGKSSANPDAQVVADVAEDALRWAEAQKAAEAAMREELWARRDHQRDFEERWAAIEQGAGIVAPLPVGWELTIDRLMSSGLSMLLIADCAFTAMSTTRVRPADKFRYMCGVAWKRVSRLHDVAHATLAGPAVSPPPEPPEEPPILEMADRLLEEVVDAFKGTRAMRRLASDALWASFAGGAQAFEKAVESGADPKEEALEVAFDEASSIRAFYMYHLGQAVRRGGEA